MNDSEHRVLTKSEMGQLVEVAVSAVLKRFFGYLDLDLEDHNSMKRFRTNLEFLDRQREGSERLKTSLRNSAIYVISVALIGMMYFSWDIVKAGISVTFLK